jgi:hypothetical protein
VNPYRGSNPYRDSLYIDHTDFSRGKRNGSYYITVFGESTPGRNNVVAQNFNSSADATRWANTNISSPYKIWKVESK